MSGSTLPGTGDDESPDRVVLHVDMDCFYASCERLREPALRGEPVVVGMGYEAGETIGAVATASYEAREYDVDSAQPISRAVERLPPVERPDLGSADDDRGHYRPVDMEFYQSVAGEVKAILHDCADTVREVSIDEAYLDVTDRTSWATVDAPASASGAAERRTLAEGLARHVRERIAREVGVPASVGVAPNMAAAKVASDHDKPDGLTVVPPGDVTDFLAPLPVEEIHGVGPVRASDLRELGIETAGDLASADPRTLQDRFGDRGRELYDRARGVDDREVTPTGLPKSLSRESSFAEATTDGEAMREKVRALAAAVAERARSKDALYRTIGIKVVTTPYDVNTRAESLSGPVDEPELVEEVALSLLEEFADSEVRKLGVRVSKLSFTAGEQASLDGFDGHESRGEAVVDGSTAEPDASENATAEPADRPTVGEDRSGQFSLEEFE
ncbi:MULTISPECIES: DNA polymerase IV [Halolamina]|uniref:DNA polymerase IV n=1 Tax=Halolamina pelagica TaxID=699431 RepID=A0A1I5P5M7_9EURY|nr:MULTISPECIES: DNA polymerase IV [Halolamina]NHX36640.1 DNA polymerase IV [Halolamina sp. R1-12]SFP29257.1 DNA polymerase IV (DinB-like DNA polymerase) [Halolamina pelagica]